MLIEMAAIGAVGSLLYSADKSNRMDQQAMEKRSRAFTKECEAGDLVARKRQNADKKMSITAKRKRAVLEASIPRFVEVYQKIQQIEFEAAESLALEACSRFSACQTLERMEIVSARQLTDQQLVAEWLFKGLGGMMIADSERNLSAASSQMRAANVVSAQARSVAEVYDAIAEHAERLSKLIMRMNTLFLGSIAETERVIARNGLSVRRYSEADKGVLMTCVNLAQAMLDIVGIPILDENGQLAEAAAGLIETGESYIAQMNELIAQ